MKGVDGESYEPIDWSFAAWWVLVTVGFLGTLYVAWDAGRAQSAHLAIEAYEREAQYRALLVPMVEQMETTLDVVRDLDVRAYDMVRSKMPADVRSILEEVQP